MNEKLWYLKNCTLFERLAPADLERLERSSLHKLFPKNSLVYLPNDGGESVYLVVSGRVRLYHLTAEGKQAVLAFIDPGEVFGELSVFDEGEREEFAETMEPTALIRIPRVDVQALMEQHADVALGISRLIGLRRKRIERRLKSLLFRSNRERLVHLLMELTDKYGVGEPDGVRLRIKLSHQELANIIGSTRESVTVVLGDLQAEGSLQVKRRQIVIKDLERLARSIAIAPPKVPDTPPPKPVVPPASTLRTEV